MEFFDHPVDLILGLVLILSSLGVILAKKPVHASLSFLLTLMTLATLYLQLSAQFIAVMQVLVYAGAIMVLFMFVMIIFQDAIEEIAHIKPKSLTWFIYLSGATFFLSTLVLGVKLIEPNAATNGHAEGFGTAEALGRLLYIDYFFPFEAVILIFLVALIGALYTAKKVNT